MPVVFIVNTNCHKLATNFHKLSYTTRKESFRGIHVYPNDWLLSFNMKRSLPPSGAKGNARKLSTNG